MRIDRDLVEHVSHLAALELEEHEAESLARQLTRIVEHFETLRSLPDELLSGLPEPLPTPLREDEAVAGNASGVMAGNAPEMSHGHFVVPRVVSRGS